MATLASDAEKDQTIRLERRDGILPITFQTNGGPLQWGEVPHREFPEAFRDMGRDPDTKVVILTGSGEAFSGPRAMPEARRRRPAAAWDKTYWEGKHLRLNLLDIAVPMISAINGPALRHSAVPLLCDIVLAAEETTLQDSAHVANGLVPGDGMPIVYPLLMGLNRGRDFLLTGQTLTARQAQEMGVVHEVLPRVEVWPRAWALAEPLTQQPRLVLRDSRVRLTPQLKRQRHDLLGDGLALEGLGVAAESSGHPPVMPTAGTACGEGIGAGVRLVCTTGMEEGTWTRSDSLGLATWVVGWPAIFSRPAIRWSCMIRGRRPCGRSWHEKHGPPSRPPRWPS